MGFNSGLKWLMVIGGVYRQTHWELGGQGKRERYFVW